MSFAQSLYMVDENNGPAQLELVLSSPLATDIDITVQVIKDVMANLTGEF